MVPHSVTLQDRSGPEGFDDVGVFCLTRAGDVFQVHVQAKLKFAFTNSDGFPQLVLGVHDHDRANPGGWSAVIAVGERSPKMGDIDALCTSARSSPSWESFHQKWDQSGASNENKRRFLEAMAAILIEEDRGATWRVLRRLRVVDCDFHDAASRDRNAAIRELQGSLLCQSPLQASDLFELLRAEALRNSSTAASYDRVRLLERLGLSLRMRPQSALRAGIAAVEEASSNALQSIRAHLAGRSISPALCLLRPELDLTLRPLLRNGATINIIGEAGAGKSAALKRAASGFEGATTLLKDDRLTARGWAEFAVLHGIHAQAEEFLDEFAARGPCLLALDAVDRMLLSPSRGLIADLLRALANSTLRARWTVATTSRVHLRGDLAVAALAEAGFTEIRNVTVEGILQKDVSFVSNAFPGLASFLQQQDMADRNRILFLLNVALAAPTEMHCSTEVGLATSWATWGENEMPAAPKRDVALSQIGEAILLRPETGLGVADIDAEGRVHLLADGIISNHPARDSLSFVHDVYEDWVLLRALQRHMAELPQLIEKAGQPPFWQKALRLLGQSMLESGDIAGWKNLIADFDETSLDPAWSRSLIASAFHTEQASSVLARLEPLFLENGGAFLRRVFETLLVFETYCDEEVFRPDYLEGMSKSDRLRAVAAFRIPYERPWVMFLAWSIGRWRTWPVALIPKLVELAETWIYSRRGKPGRLARLTVETSIDWLERIEEARNIHNRTHPFGERLPAGELELTTERLRRCVSLSGVLAPASVSDFVQRLASVAGYCESRTELMRSPGYLPQSHPKEFADLAVSHFLPARPQFARNDPFRGLPFRFSSIDDAGISNCHDQSPASPLRYGFSSLFLADERQALRLFHRLEMRMSVHYRHSSCLRDRRKAVPVRLHASRGIVQLWGDENIYRWSRALLGPDVLGSAYLALDDWMHKQASDGRPLDELFDLVLQDNGLVSSALPCISALVNFARTPAQVELSLPFLEQPRLWEYEKLRHRDDAFGVAFPSFWQRDRMHHEAVDKIRKRYAKRVRLESELALRFHVLAGSESHEALKARRDKWSASDLAAYEQELVDVATMSDYRRSIERQKFFADPTNVQSEPQADPTRTAFWFREPQGFDSERDRVMSENADLNKAASLGMWVSRSRKMGRLDQRFSLEEAKEMAFELEGMACPQGDAAWLFQRSRAVGILGTAALLIRFSGGSQLEVVLPWAEANLVSVCKTFRDNADGRSSESANIPPDDAFIVAAEGLGLLIGKGLGNTDHRRLALELATWAPAEIACALVRHVIPEATYFHWNLLVAALVTCVFRVQHPWEKGDASRVVRERLAQRRRVIRLSLGHGYRNTRLRVPPDPYVNALLWFGSWRRPVTRVRKINNVVFEHQRAAKLLKMASVPAIVASDRYRTTFETYLLGLASWSVEYSGHKSPGSHFPYELAHQIAKTMGNMAAAGGSIESWRTLTRFHKDRQCESLVGDYLDAVTTELVISGRSPDERFWAAWNPASEWAFASFDIDGADFDEHRSLGAAFQAAGFIGPYRTPIPPNWPHLEAILPAVDNWFRKAAFSRTAVTAAFDFAEKLDAAQRAQWLLPWLDLLIEKHGRSERFWESLGDTATALSVCPGGSGVI